jgi:hypothetical protein
MKENKCGEAQIEYNGKDIRNAQNIYNIKYPIP